MLHLINAKKQKPEPVGNANIAKMQNAAFVERPKRAAPPVRRVCVSYIQTCIDNPAAMGGLAL